MGRWFIMEITTKSHQCWFLITFPPQQCRKLTLGFVSCIAAWEKHNLRNLMMLLSLQSLLGHLACIYCFFSDCCKTVKGLAYKSSFNSLLQHLQESPTCQDVRQHYGNTLVQAHELSMAKEVEQNRGCHSGCRGSSRLQCPDLPWLWMVQSTIPMFVVMMLDRKLSVTNDLSGIALIWGEGCSHIPCVRKKVDYKGWMQKRRRQLQFFVKQGRGVLLIGHYVAALEINSFSWPFKLIYHISLWNWKYI